MFDYLSFFLCIQCFQLHPPQSSCLPLPSSPYPPAFHSFYYFCSILLSSYSFISLFSLCLISPSSLFPLSSIFLLLLLLLSPSIVSHPSLGRTFGQCPPLRANQSFFSFSIFPLFSFLHSLFLLILISIIYLFIYFSLYFNFLSIFY